MAYYPPLSVSIKSSKGFSHPLFSPSPIITSSTDLLDTPFPFLSLPRELRDLVYSYTFHDRGIRYRDHIKPTTRWSQPRTFASYINLLLTSRQIHAEAVSELFRTRIVEISPRKPHRTRDHLNALSLSHVLCSFPVTPARLITRLQIVYFDYSINFPSLFPSDGDDDLMFAMWDHIVRDAWMSKAHFPHLNKFEALSRMLGSKMVSKFFDCEDDCHTLDESKRCQRGEQIAARIVSWLECELDVTEFVPPQWLKMTISNESEASDSYVGVLRFQHEVLEQLHLLLAKKRKITHEEIEASGRVWLEKCSIKRKRGRKGWCEEMRL